MTASVLEAVRCPLPPTSDLPIPLDSLKAFNEYARRVLADFGAAPIEARRSEPVETPSRDPLDSWAGTRSAWGSEYFRARKRQRAAEGPSGPALRALRVAEALPLSAVCAATGLSHGGLQAIETGRRVPPASDRQRIADAVRALAAARRARPCVACGGAVPVAKQASARYCSERCVALADRARQRARYAIRIGRGARA